MLLLLILRGLLEGLQECQQVGHVLKCEPIAKIGGHDIGLEAFNDMNVGLDHRLNQVLVARGRVAGVIVLLNANSAASAEAW